LFTVLPLELAAKSYLFLHLLGAGLGTYALARTLRMNVPGALMAAIAYEFSGFTFERNVCCFAYTGIMLWLPLALLCSERAIRTTIWLYRGLWCGLAGVAVSQVLAAWLGQGAYYALLALGGYIGYRSLVAPPEYSRAARQRVITALACGLGVLLFGFGLAAAGLLPRLEYNALSNLAAGYPGSQAAVHSGWPLRSWYNLVYRLQWYAGIVPLVLALLAPFLARNRHAVPYWLALAAGTLVLTGQGPTPLHSLVYLLPQFRNLHPHDPERIIMIFYLPVGLLAGATVTRLSEQRLRLPTWAALVPFAVVVPVLYGYNLLSWRTCLALALAGVGLALYTLRLRRPYLVSGLLLLVTFVDLLSVGHVAVWKGWGEFRKVDLQAYYQPQGSGEYLLLRHKDGNFRYFGYNPKIRRLFPRDRSIPPTGIPYRYQWSQTAVAALLVNNRALVLGLEDAQGYDPIHVARFDQFMRALNGQAQEYRGSYVFENGLTSPLLPLLNARYIVSPTNNPRGQADLSYLTNHYRTVYVDPFVRVLYVPNALPRAWLVHDAVKGDLSLLASGKVDPARTVVLEQDPPLLGAATAGDSVMVSRYSPQEIQLEVRAGSDAMLALSEVYYPIWRAYVDGQRTEVYAADHAFRAVKVPQGRHTVVMRYESDSQRNGLLVTVTFCVLVAVLGAIALSRVDMRRWK
ncbi:MAG: YfhO family protein, partial [Chloroflexota bacterium]|nr:YfhO family protein [Chloroflexota bacterium]